VWNRKLPPPGLGDWDEGKRSRPRLGRAFGREEIGGWFFPLTFSGKSLGKDRQAPKDNWTLCEPPGEELV